MCCIVCRIPPWGWCQSVCLSVCKEDAAPAGAVLRAGCTGGALVMPLVSQGSDSSLHRAAAVARLELRGLAHAAAALQEVPGGAGPAPGDTRPRCPVWCRPSFPPSSSDPRGLPSLLKAFQLSSHVEDEVVWVRTEEFGGPGPCRVAAALHGAGTQPRCCCSVLKLAPMAWGSPVAAAPCSC